MKQMHLEKYDVKNKDHIEVEISPKKITKKPKKKTRGRSKLGKRLKRKQYNIVTKERVMRSEQLAERKREERAREEGRSVQAGTNVSLGAALSIFGKKKKASRSRTSR